MLKIWGLTFQLNNWKSIYIKKKGLNKSRFALKDHGPHDRHISTIRKMSNITPTISKRKLSKHESIFTTFSQDQYAKIQQDFSLTVDRHNENTSQIENESNNVNLSKFKGQIQKADTRDILFNELSESCFSYINSFESFVEFYQKSSGDVATQLLLLRFAVYTYGIDKVFNNESNQKTTNGNNKDWTIKDEIIHFYKIAFIQYDWNVIRYTTSLLKICVHSLSPNVTFLLISGKPISIGIYGKEEIFYRTPPSPGKIMNDIEEIVGRNAPREASLHQEIITHLRSEFQMKPKNFKRLYTLRIGSIIQAMRYVNDWRCVNNKTKIL